MRTWEYRRFHHCSSIPFSLNPNRRVAVVSGCCFPLREKWIKLAMKPKICSIKLHVIISIYVICNVSKDTVFLGIKDGTIINMFH